MNHCNFFYEEESSGNQRPRSIFVDTEPSLQHESLMDRYGSPIDRLRTGVCRDLFAPEQLFNFNSSALTFGVGYYLQEVETAIEGLRRQVEMCESLQGFMILNAISGGTGSGMTSKVLEELGDEYTKKI